MGGTYKGPLEALRGQHAMIQTNPKAPGTIKAQFDDVNLTLDDFASAVHLGYGWHKFPAEHFDMDLEFR